MTEMNSDETGEEAPVIKTDVLGRVKVSRERREALLDEFEKSALSAPRFAELSGVKYQTFATWLQKRKRERGQYRALREAPGLGKPASCEGGANDGRLASNPERMQWFEAVVEASGNVRASDIASGSQSFGELRVELPGGARLSLRSPAEMALAVEFIEMLAKKTARLAC